MTKRMRVFAGPNGSGKTTIFKGILDESKIQLGVYVNADEIEETLRKKKKLNFSDFEINATTDELKNFFIQSQFSIVKRIEPDLIDKFFIEENIFFTTAIIDSYLSADLADFIRNQLLKNGVSLTYETVMSHPGKVDFLKKAKMDGFRVYLYFIATEDPEININRVNIRVAQDGHPVSPNVIRDRYYKSLANLKSAVKATSRAYIFDNSQNQASLISEITDGRDVSMNTAKHTPDWVIKYLID